ncbi:MAG: non-homologous end-joining DNA ligase [Syntrophomonas sp.]|uniref:non-homologous end-joining DNA ligase n=1 Tax=Syntrophomonas sp. TaxID=2053627 RepID=UPI0026253262|nr:non-homologous end-joining DNA ligase [Syntrophomonas sp.]MDD4627426.1 non-homologous end-joining DNA ligase [Syntrophomonas sp.]
MEIFLREIRSMDPINCEQAFDSDDFLYQVKWDGVRMLVAVAGEQVSLLNKRGNLRTGQYPELQNLPNLIRASTAVLDGEIVVLREGKPSFPAVMQRDNCRNPMKIQHLSKTLAISYMVFDLLYLNGRDLRSASLLDRLSQLAEIFDNQGCLYLVESFSQGTTLFDSVQRAGLEGIVAKRKNSYYRPGKQHDDWFKIKCLRSQACLVGGYTLRGKQVNALLLGVMRDGSLSFAGKAGNGLDTEQLQILSETLPRLEVKDSPFLEPTPAGSHYITPQLAVQVEYLEWTDSLHLRFPVIKSFMKNAGADCSV